MYKVLFFVIRGSRDNLNNINKHIINEKENNLEYKFKNITPT